MFFRSNTTVASSLIFRERFTNVRHLVVYSVWSFLHQKSEFLYIIILEFYNETILLFCGFRYRSRLLCYCQKSFMNLIVLKSQNTISIFATNNNCYHSIKSIPQLHPTRSIS